MKVIQLTRSAIKLIAPIGGEDKVRQLLTEHLLRLKPEDRYLRFFNAMTDFAIEKYISKVDFTSHGIFVIFDEAGANIVAFLHASKFDGEIENEYELGMTVDEEHRGSGIGYELFKTGVSWAKSMVCKRIYVNCLYQNKAMQKIAEKFNMETKSIDYETKEGEIKIPHNHVDIFSYLTHHAGNNMLLLDLAYRRNLNALT